MKKQLLTLLLACLTSLLGAQEQEKHEFTFGLSSGLFPLKPLSSAFKSGIGMSLGYNYFFNDKTGMSTGIDFSYFKSRSQTGQISDRYFTDDGNESFEFRSTIDNHRETQTAYCLSVPLMWRIQYPLFHDDILNWFAIGGKVFVPLRARYETSGTAYTTSAYYPKQDVLLESGRGLGTFTGGKQVFNLDFRTVYMLSAETGIKLDVSYQFSLYAGIYADYALNNINRDSGRKPFLVYHPENPEYFHFNSVLNSAYTQEDGKTVRLSDRINPFTAGIVIRIAFKLPE
jgi:hypothetical protein